MFATVPVFLTSGSVPENQIIQPGLIRKIMPHADVEIDTGAAAAVEAFFTEADSLIIVLSMADMTLRLTALTGVVDDYGTTT